MVKIIIKSIFTLCLSMVVPNFFVSPMAAPPLTLKAVTVEKVGGEPNFGSFRTHDQLFIRTAHWPAQGKKQGTIILAQGMGGFIEGYSNFTQQLSQKGYDVLSFDWRGQGGSDRITNKETLLHINSFEDYLKDLEHFISLQKNMTYPLILVGNSMGGNIALRYVRDHPNVFHAVILLSPMVDINTSPYPYPVARGIASLASTLGGGEMFVLGYNTFTPEACLRHYDHTKNGSIEKYTEDCHVLAKKPHLAVGGPSFNWLQSAFESCDVLRDPNFPRDINIPVLMVSALNDHMVNTDAQLDLCRSMPYCQQIVYGDAHHNILKEEDDVFERLMDDISQFMKECHFFDKKKPSSLSPSSQISSPVRLAMDITP